MKFNIDKNIPLPDAWPGFVQTLRSLSVGDSFLVEDPGLCTPSTVYSLARREGIRVSVRQMEGGIRIWRVQAHQHMDTAGLVVRARKNLNFRMHADRDIPSYRLLSGHEST